MPKILIVDDDKVVVEVIKKILVGQNYEVATAYDGKEGIEKVKSEKPDLIILDIRMPSMNGYEFMRTLRSELANADGPMVPVIVLTAIEKMEKVFKAEGAKGYLVKPVDPPVLLAEIEGLLKKSPFEGKENLPKILIVDDELEFNVLLQTRLEACGYETVTAKDGEEGLEKVESEKPDLIVLDVMMPKIDGFEVCSTLKNDARYSKIPIIFLSAMAQQDNFRTGKEAGADAYIVKPFETPVLIAKIEKLLKKSSSDKRGDILRKKEKLLGEMFVEKGLVTEDQVQAVIQEQEQLTNKKLLGEMLVEKGLITEDNLFMTLAEQFSIEYMKLADKEIDWDVPTGLPSSFITKHRCIPMRVDEEKIMLIIADPSDMSMIELAENEAAPNKIKVVLVKTSDMDEAIKEYQKHSSEKR